MKPLRIALPAVLLAVAGTVGLAQIERLTLDQMVARTDGAVYGEIVARSAFVVDDPIAGPDNYFTTLTISGRSLIDGTQITVDVIHHGGWIDPDHGAWNSEAPTLEETEPGRNVVVFYKWSDNMGAGVSGNALYASHGGLYTTVDGPGGTVVLGRGEGYAVARNVAISDLDEAISQIAGKH